ncbi:hypothetical protein [Psychrobium sp. 1_MG-2023]|nr:hypothetical protein [Psychrobium sp. 1_MG-2023]MDP2562450.1 hypothetical protein [Psychrobium sp. 1_MG-2023]
MLGPTTCIGKLKTRMPARQNAKVAAVLWGLLTIPFAPISLVMFFAFDV